MTTRSDLQEAAARLERDMALTAIKGKDYRMARKHFYRTLDRLKPLLGHSQCDALFVSTTLELSNLCFVLGRGFTEILDFLQGALTVAERLGNRRSKGLIMLHLGRLYYFAERRSEAIKAFSGGKAEIEELGDDDILIQAGEFLGLYFHMQGLFKEAQKYFELAAETFEPEREGSLTNPSAAMWLCYCDAYLGHFHRAIGRLDYHRRLTIEKSDHTLATTLRAVLGLILLMIKKNKEGAKELSEALKEATKSKNALALYFCRGGLAYYYLLAGRPQKSRDWLALCIGEGAASGLVRQYASPFIIEILYEFDSLGLEPIPEFSFPREVDRLMREPNVHLRGVALRLKAQAEAAHGGDIKVIESNLADSEDCLRRSGDPIQLAKTQMEIARLKLREGDREKARLFAQKAWAGLSSYRDVFFPDDLRPLVVSNIEVSANHNTREELLELFMAMIQEVVPGLNLNRILNRTVAATTRFFSAERGGVFWFSRNTSQKEPELRVGCNLSRTDVEAEEFQSNLSLVFKADRENEPQVVRREGSDLSRNQARAVLCLPIEFQGQVQGVLYQDNSYVKDCFDFFDKCQMVRLARSLTTYIENMISLRQRVNQKVSMNLGQIGKGNYTEIMTQNTVMLRTLDQADRVAASDSTVLILGETGVGKELLARRLHRMSLRSSGPFVVVEPTTIPEALIESELFGHERGAFTGAERQKPGRLELAHRGTLFIDEVGEIPKSVQVKLLRALEERSLVRIGGTQRLYSDFRLLAATNRDLAEEVAVGRFREDLYYRLNVVPIIIPPLRDRIDDIPLLSRHFIKLYASKNGRPVYELMSQDEARLREYSWPGNVRELQNVIERSVLLTDGQRLKLSLPSQAKKSSASLFTDHLTLDELQRRYIRYVLEKTDGKISGSKGAASLLGMKRTSLYNRMKKLGIR
jgi:transcriptional regulator with GAF, ATPase, and Fis domain